MISSRSVAEKALNERDFLTAIGEARNCIELTAKAFLDEFEISYEIPGKKGAPMHDVSSEIPKLMEKVRPHMKEREISQYRKDFARSGLVR